MRKDEMQRNVYMKFSLKDG